MTLVPLPRQSLAMPSSFTIFLNVPTTPPYLSGAPPDVTCCVCSKIWTWSVQTEETLRGLPGWECPSCCSLCLASP